MDSGLLSNPDAPKATSRVPIDAANGVTGALFGIAILAYTCRLYIQLFVFKRFPAEDWLILFSVIILIAATVLWYISVNNLYNALVVVLEGVGSSKLFDVLKVIPTESKQANALSTLWWFVIFPVKFAYLVFFKKLINRLKHLTRYWWVVTAFMIPALIINEVVAWQTCPYTEALEVIAKCSGADAGTRLVRVTSVTTVFDVLGDVAIASIPVTLLWRVRISLRQKIGLGLTLCLSLVMAIVAIIRISGSRLPTGDADIVWVTFWQQQECNVAVIMISLTAFRSFFIRDTDSAMHAQPFLWSKLSIDSIKSSFRKRFSRLFGKSREDQTPTVDSGSTMIQSGGGSGIGSNPGPGSTETSGLDSGSARTGRSKKPMFGSPRGMKEVKIPNGRFSGLWSAIDRAGRTRAESPGASMV